MEKRQPGNMGGPGKTAATDDLHAAVLDFINRGRRAQEAVDRILANEPDRRRTARPKGRA